MTPSERVRAAMAKGEVVGDVPMPGRLLFKQVDELEGQPYPPRQWFVPEWVPDRQVTSLYGSGGTGKSLLAMQLCTAGALGGDWLGMPIARRKCLYLSCEDDQDELHRRQSDINTSMGIGFADFEGRYAWLARPGEDNPLMEFTKAGAGRPTKFAHQLLEQCCDEGIQFIVVDTAADTFAGNEIVRAEVRQFLSYLRRIAMEIDGAVMLLAHPSIAGSKDHGYSGSTAWHGGVRSLLTLKNAEDSDEPYAADLRVLTREKANYAKAGHELSLRWQSGCFRSQSIPTSVDDPQRAFLDQELFKTGLGRLLDQGLCPSASKNQENYAPKLMKRTLTREFQSINSGRLEQAMRSLLEAGEIGIQTHWKGSSPLTPTGYDLAKWRKGKADK